MSKYKMNKKMKIALIKLIATICFIGIVFFVGAYEVGWENILNGDLEEIYENANQLITELTNDEKIWTEYDSESDEEQVVGTISGDFEVYVFDVGQADCTLITCGNEYMLIDGGNNEDGKLVANQLKSMGIEAIDYMIGTHPDEDHVGGLDEVIKALNVETLYLPKREKDTATYKSVKTAAKNNGVEIVTPKLGYKFNLGGAVCEVMLVDAIADDNSCSIALQITYGKNSFLFMGDAETDAEETRLWNDIDVLKVGHHGSSTSSSDDFLAQTQPELALVSAGLNNKYGHPHREVVAALKEYDAEMHRTDQEGTLHVVSDGTAYTFESLDIHLDGNQD